MKASRNRTKICLHPIRIPAEATLEELLGKIGPRKIILTGLESLEGIQITLRIARYLKQQNRLDCKIFYALANHPEIYLQTVLTLLEEQLFNQVQVLLGSSLQQSMLHAMKPDSKKDRAWTPEMGAGRQFLPDDLLKRCLEDFESRPDIVICCSPKNVAILEIREALKALRGPSYFLMCDIDSATPPPRNISGALSRAVIPAGQCTDPKAILLRTPTERPIAGKKKRGASRTETGKTGPLSIAIVLLEHMGDIVACEPVIRHVKMKYPDCFLTWVVKEEYRELVESHPLLDEVLTVGCITEWRLISMGGIFDKIINLHINGRNCFHCGCLPISQWQTRHDVTLEDYYNHGPLLPVFSSCAGLPPLTDAPQLHIPDYVKARVDEMLLPEEFIVFHCTSNELSRDWQNERWIALAHQLKKAWGGAIIEIGSKACIADSIPNEVVNLCGRISILESAEIIRRARVFVGIDSGPAHLGNAVGTPGVVLLGDYKAFHNYLPFTGDYANGKNATLVYAAKGSARTIKASNVADAVLHHLKRSKRDTTTAKTGDGLSCQPPLTSAKKRSDPQLIAFYLPQYHPVPENDRWWGKGFTEWSNVLQGKPLFDGHYQPHIPGELGCYDLRLEQVMLRQAEMARHAGIAAFCFWHYWFEGKLLLERPLLQLLESGKPDFPFCLAWANESWTRRWDGQEREVLMPQTYGGNLDDRKHFDWLARFFQDSRYFKVEGRPLFLIYRAFHMKHVSRTLSNWKRTAEKIGILSPYFVAVRTHFDGHEAESATALGFDAELMFHPNSPDSNRRILELMRRKHSLFPQLYAQEIRAVQEKGATICEYDESWPIMADLRNASAWPCIVPSWDNTSRRARQGAFILDRATPVSFERWLKYELKRSREKPRGPRMIFLNAWNEWAEGCHLEPDLKYKSAFLEATRRALDKQSSRESSTQALARARRLSEVQPIARRVVGALHQRAGSSSAAWAALPPAQPPSAPAAGASTSRNQDLLTRVLEVLSAAASGADASGQGQDFLVDAIGETLKYYDALPLLTQFYNCASDLVVKGKKREARLLFLAISSIARDVLPELCGKSHYKLAQLSARTRDAISHLQQCLRLYPEHRAARQLLQDLKRHMRNK